MKKIPFLKFAMLLAVGFCFINQKSIAQNNQNGGNNSFPVLGKVRPHNNPNAEGEPFPVPDVEVGPIVDQSKLKSNDPSYQYKPKWDYFVDGVKWINEHLGPPIIRALPGGSGSKSGSILYPSTGHNDYSFSKANHGPSYAGFPENNYSKSEEPMNSFKDRNYYFSLGIGLGIGTRGAKQGNEVDNIFYLQLPIIMVRYNYILPAGGTLYAQAGGYFAVALPGTYKSPNNKRKLSFGNNADRPNTYIYSNSLQTAYIF